MKSNARRARRSGQALIIVLGTLTVFVLLIVGFSVGMRSHRATARDSLNEVRARQLLHAALAHALADVMAASAGTNYPCWSPVEDAFASSGPGAACSNLFAGAARDWVPRAGWPAAASVIPRWVAVPDSDGATNGRIAYLVINDSGLIDANRAGGAARTTSTDPAELDLSALPELAGAAGAFYANRAIHKRYECVEELARLNTNAFATQPAHLCAYSYDPGRDAFYTNEIALGTPDIGLVQKFWINGSSATNVDALSRALADCGVSNAAAAAWNVVNYLDEDRIPQSDETAPWLSTRIVEAVPLINEVVRRGAGAGQSEIAVELFFPFFPARVRAADNFTLQVGLFTNALTATTDMQAGSFGLGGSWTVGDMAWGTTNAFRVYRSPTFPDTTTVWFLARVLCSGMPVDQAPGAEPLLLSGNMALSVDDPRGNGDPTNWTVEAETLGTTNANMTAWADPVHGQGLPICHRDGPMQSIAEIGNIYASSSATQKWQTIDLLSPTGGKLLDRLTVRAVNAPMQGLVAISSSYTNVLKVLFHGMPIGYANDVVSVRYAITNAAAENNICAALWNGAPYQSWEDLMHRTGVVNAFRGLATDVAPAGTQVGDILREAPLAGILDLVTFRQNLFTVIVAAQPFGARGTIPVAERRAVAVVCRDAYTGRAFVRCLHLLTED